MRRKLIVLLAVLVMASVSFGSVVVSSWEDASGDNDIDWGSKAGIETGTAGATATYTFGATVGVTDGSDSLRVDQSGWGQSLSVYVSGADFFANDTFSIDISVKANDGTIEGGYSQVYEVAACTATDGSGWTALATGTPVNFYWWGGSEERTETLTIDYSSVLAPFAGASQVYFVFALNNGGGAPTDMYFDNAVVTPEPTTIALLGLGGLLLRRRK